MSKPEVIEKTPMNVVEVKAALEIVKEQEPELNFRAAKTWEYCEDFSRIDPKEAAQLLEKLRGLEIPRLRDQHLHKLIDLMPVSEKHVKIILSSMNVTPTAENAKKIADVIVEYAKK